MVPYRYLDGTLAVPYRYLNGTLMDPDGTLMVPGQKGFQISAELKLRLKMIKINAVKRRLSRQGVKFCL